MWWISAWHSCIGKGQTMWKKSTPQKEVSLKVWVNFKHLPRQSLSKKVCNVLLRGHICQINLSSRVPVLDVVMVRLNVPSVSMKHRIIAISNALWLSVKTVVAEDWMIPKSAKRCMSYALSSHCESDLASLLDVATVGCFLLNQDILELPSMKPKPLIDTWVS